MTEIGDIIEIVKCLLCHKDTENSGWKVCNDCKKKFEIPSNVLTLLSELNGQIRRLERQTLLCRMYGDKYSCKIQWEKHN